MNAISNMQFVVWEYNDELIGQENKAFADYKIGPVLDGNTDKIKGIYFSWKYLLQKDNQICLHSVCRDNYSTIPKNLMEIKLQLYNSLENFKRIFQERLDLLELTVAQPSYPVDDISLLKVLEELNRQ